MYNNGWLVSTPHEGRASQILRVTVQDPGDEGVALTWRWEHPCTEDQALRVTHSSDVYLSPPPECAGSDPLRVRVRFVNDLAQGNTDRNVGVMWAE